jgi:hypothetical protein
VCHSDLQTKLFGMLEDWGIDFREWLTIGANRKLGIGRNWVQVNCFA